MQILCSLLIVILYMFRASLAHHQELRKLCVQPGVLFSYSWFCFCLLRAVFVQGFVGPGLVCDRTPIQDPQNLAQIQHVTNKNRIKNNWIRHLAAHTVFWAPDDERVTLETCRVLLSIKSTKSASRWLLIWSLYNTFLIVQWFLFI